MDRIAALRIAAASGSGCVDAIVSARASMNMAGLPEAAAALGEAERLARSAEARARDELAGAVPRTVREVTVTLEYRVPVRVDVPPEDLTPGELEELAAEADGRLRDGTVRVAPSSFSVDGGHARPRSGTPRGTRPMPFGHRTPSSPLGV